MGFGHGISFGCPWRGQGERGPLGHQRSPIFISVPWAVPVEEERLGDLLGESIGGITIAPVSQQVGTHVGLERGQVKNLGPGDHLVETIQFPASDRIYYFCYIIRRAAGPAPAAPAAAPRPNDRPRASPSEPSVVRFPRARENGVSSVLPAPEATMIPVHLAVA
jgi:hypothetical protein